MNRGRDAASRLEHGLAAMARDARLTVAVETIGATPWASALFVGEQVRVSLCGADTARFAAWIAALPEADVPLRGYLVADIFLKPDGVTPGHRRWEALALLIEDRADGPS